MKIFKWNRMLALFGAVAVLAGAAPSQAQPMTFPDRDPRAGIERLPIHLNGQEFQAMRGQDTVPLRALLERTYGRGITAGRDLLRVVVVAKSRFGRGQMQLLVGNTISYPQTVFGHPEAYDYPGGYYRMVFDNPAGHFSEGVWQLKLQGLIRIERIVVVTRNRYVGGPYPYPGPHPGPYPQPYSDQPSPDQPYPDQPSPDQPVPQPQPFPRPGRPGPR